MHDLGPGIRYIRTPIPFINEDLSIVELGDIRLVSQSEAQTLLEGIRSQSRYAQGRIAVLGFRSNSPTSLCIPESGIIYPVDPSADGLQWDMVADRFRSMETVGALHIYDSRGVQLVRQFPAGLYD